MIRKYIITEENAKEIKAYRKEIKEKSLDRRLYAVQLLGEGNKPKAIAEKLDADKRQISKWASDYCTKGGITGLAEKRGGRHRENMSKEEEKELLERFKEKAEKGQVVTTKEIKAAYEEKIGRSVNGNQIHYVLRRNEWRKVMPRSKHPKKASEEAIEASKKLKQK